MDLYLFAAITRKPNPDPAIGHMTNPCSKMLGIVEADLCVRYVLLPCFPNGLDQDLND